MLARLLMRLHMLCHAMATLLLLLPLRLLLLFDATRHYAAAAAIYTLPPARLAMPVNMLICR